MQESVHISATSLALRCRHIARVSISPSQIVEEIQMDACDGKHTHKHTHTHRLKQTYWLDIRPMGWLWLVGSIKL